MGLSRVVQHNQGRGIIHKPFGKKVCHLCRQSVAENNRTEDDVRFQFVHCCENNTAAYSAACNFCSIVQKSLRCAKTKKSKN